jgi:hypothetical protein
MEVQGNSFVKSCATLALLFLCLSVNAQWVNNGTATCEMQCCTLTLDVPGQSGNIFSINTINLNQAFEFEAVLNFGCKDANGADGIVFVLSAVNNLVGTGGGGIGYAGIAPSVAVEMDTYHNSEFGDIPADHLAIITNGSVDHNAASNLGGPLAIPNVEDCMDHCFYVSWNPATQQFTASLDDYYISYFGDIRAFVGDEAYFGFTGSTGGLSNVHTVCVYENPSIVPMQDVTICEGESIQLQADPDGASWLWQNHPTLSETEISNPIATPSVTTTYTVTITIGCEEFVDNVTVHVFPIPIVDVIHDAPLCEGESLVLISVTDGSTYLWNGPQGFVSIEPYPVISPVTAQNSGTYTLTVSNGTCEATVETEVVIEANPITIINPIDQPVCQNASSIQLTASPEGGIWSGAADAFGIIHPTNLIPGIHQVFYQYFSPADCYGEAEYEIQISAVPEAILMGDLMICDEDFSNVFLSVKLTGNPPFVLEYSVNGQSFTQTFNQAGTVQLPVSTPGDYLLSQISDGNGCFGIVSGMANVQLLPQAEMSISQIECDENREFYSIEIVLNGFIDMNEVIFSGSGGVLQPIENNIVRITDIPSGNAYRWEIYDSFECDTLILEGTFNCACETFSGTIDTIHYTACVNMEVHIDHMGDEVLEPGEALFYILHDGSTDSVGTVFQINQTGIFYFSAELSVDVTYLIQAVAGDSMQLFNLNFNTACISFSMPATVRFLALRGISLDGVAPEYCFGDSLLVGISFQGIAPFKFFIDNGLYSDTLISEDLNYQIMMEAAESTALRVVLISDGIDSLCVQNSMDSLAFTVYPILYTEETIRICRGDSSLIFGTYIMDEGVYERSFQSVNSCDSIVLINLELLENDSIFRTSGSCRPEDVGVFVNQYQNQSGCDSIEVLEVFFSLSDTSYFEIQTCEVLTSDTTMYVNTLGCDSLVIRQYNFVPPDEIVEQEVVCDEIIWGVNGQSYTQSGVYESIFQNVLGCDSIRRLELTVHRSSLDEFQVSTCTAYTWEVTGEQYTQSGVYALSLQSAEGCDSTLILNLNISDEILLEESRSTCDSFLWNTNNRIYEVSGIYSEAYVSQDGCDSIHLLNLEVHPSHHFTILAEECEQYFWNETGQFYHDSGTYIADLISGMDCDSIIELQLTIHTVDTIVQSVSASDDYYWSMTGLSYSESGTYEHVEQEEFCDVVFILVLDINRIEDVYWPNIIKLGSSANAQFFISTSPGIDRIDALNIYDRWGNIVFFNKDFSPNQADEGWDGRFNGAFASPGVYAAVISWTNRSGVQQNVVTDLTLVW